MASTTRRAQLAGKWTDRAVDRIKCLLSPRIVVTWLLALLCLQLPALAAPSRLAHFLPGIDISQVFPGADRLGAVAESLPVAPAYAGDELLGHVYVTSDFVNTRGYSSFPIDTLVAMAKDGTIVGVKLLEHNEPIVLIGISEERVKKFMDGYIGQNYVLNPPEPGALPPVDIISGATVTVIVIGDGIMRSSMLVARQLQAGQAADTAQASTQRVLDMDQQEEFSWGELLEQGAVARLHLTVEDINQRFAENARKDAADHPQKGEPDDSFIDMYVGLVSVPSIGRSLLGDREYNYLQERLEPGQQAILVAGNGIYSFKGSGYVRGGIFDRIEVIQDLASFHFADFNHQRLADVRADGAPRFREVALFTVPDDEALLDPLEPWRMQLMVQREIGPNDKVFVNYNLNYELPERYSKVVEAAAPAAPAATTAAATTDDWAAEASSQSQLWKQMWWAKRWQIAILVTALLILGGVFFFQNQVTANEKRFKIFRAAFLTFTLVWLGWYATAQLSVVNVITFVHALLTDFQWEFFLMDPLVFILWVATAVSILFWNRGAFCGWLCPFGALQELSNKIARYFKLPQIKIPYSAHTRLTAAKYVIFIGLLGASFYQVGLAEKLAEIEPFKTAIILKFMRDWWFVLFALALLTASLFIERFYCRYMCPLGAALAIPARLRIFDWLRRYQMCGNPCQLCAVECPVQAIAPEGEIQPNECIQCLNCQVLYHSEQRCPHLIARNKKRRRTKPAPTTAKPVVQAARQAPTITMSET